MPELPEVETVKRGLAPAMEGSRIKNLTLNRPDLRFPFPEGFADHVQGRSILALSRRAKYLLINLDGDLTIIAHLGMSGSFRIESAEIDRPGDFYHAKSKAAVHDHVIFEIEGPDGSARVIYNDPRRFGFMHLSPTSALESYPPFADLGPEPLGNVFSADYLADRFKSRKQPVKLALLDQANIAGLGNIYVCEALHRAGLRPDRTAASLVTETGRPSAGLNALAEAIREVIAEAIEAGGSTLRDHIRADGSLGYFQHRFSVYDRQGEVCLRDGCGGVVERLVQGGRSTFFCLRCQK